MHGEEDPFLYSRQRSKDKEMSKLYLSVSIIHISLYISIIL